MVTALWTSERVSNPSTNSPKMRSTRHGSVRVNPRRSAWGVGVRRRSSSVTGARCEPLERCDMVILHVIEEWGEAHVPGPEDRKSTRLNSSHGYISYAVFCLKKKKNVACAASCHDDTLVSNDACDCECPHE